MPDSETLDNGYNVLYRFKVKQGCGMFIFQINWKYKIVH